MPVTYQDSSLARNKAACASSSVSPERPTKATSAKGFCPLPCVSITLVILVFAIKPGQIALLRIVFPKRRDYTRQMLITHAVPIWRCYLPRLLFWPQPPRLLLHVAPSCANSSAMAKPIPPVDPVTIATLLCNLII